MTSFQDQSTKKDEKHGKKAAAYRGPFFGRRADRPGQIPMRGWKQILQRVFNEIGQDRLDIAAAGVAFYALLSLFPALTAGVSLYGLMGDPTTITEWVERLRGLVSTEILDLLREEMAKLTAEEPGGLTVGVIIGFLVALWSANRGIKALIVELNMAYNVPEERSFIQLNLLSLAMTLGSIVGVLFSIAVVGLLPAVMGVVGLDRQGQMLLELGRWPLLFLGMLLFLAVLYRFAPDRRAPKWRWITPGSLVASLLWITLSAGFAFYSSNFAAYNETYGALGAAVVLLMWFYITAFVVGIGAEINAEVERQVDTPTQEGSLPVQKRNREISSQRGA